MPKIILNASLKNMTEQELITTNVLAIKENNKIKYIDKDVTVIITIKDNIVELERKSKEYQIFMIFDLNNITDGIYDIYNIGKIKLNVKTTFLKVEHNKIEINYQMILEGIEKTDFVYKIEIKEM